MPLNTCKNTLGAKLRSIAVSLRVVDYTCAICCEKCEVIATTLGKDVAQSWQLSSLAEQVAKP
jgi:hypothetical protein